MITSLLKSIARQLDKSGIAYMIIGGQAVLLYGRARLTRDIDITLGANTDQFAQVAEVCKELGVELLPEDPRDFATKTNVLPAEEPGTSEGRTPAANATVRSVFVIGPDKKIKLMLTYPMSTGRNFDEILRVLDSMQLTMENKVATPVNWKQGEDVIILASVSDDEAKNLFPDGWTTVKPYLRTVKQPTKTTRP